MPLLKLFTLSIIVAATTAEYNRYGAHIPILQYENISNGDGSYKYSYETGNGISARESGAPRASDPEYAAVTAEGGFSYRAPDGQQVLLSYTADENGFHPVGSHIPTPPPIPEAILRSRSITGSILLWTTEYTTGTSIENANIRVAQT